MAAFAHSFTVQAWGHLSDRCGERPQSAMSAPQAAGAALSGGLRAPRAHQSHLLHEPSAPAPYARRLERYPPHRGCFVLCSVTRYTLATML